MKDKQKDQQNQIIPPEEKKKRNRQYQANPNNPIYSSDKSSPDEKKLNEKLKDIEGFSGFWGESDYAKASSDKRWEVRRETSRDTWIVSR